MSKSGGCSLLGSLSGTPYRDCGEETSCGQRGPVCDLKTEVNPADFELPSGFRQITPEELRQQTAQLMQFVQGIMGLINAQAQAVATPAAATSPAR